MMELIEFGISVVGEIGLGIAVGFVMALFGVPLFMALLRLFCFYIVVREREARVFVLFGKVIGVIDQPGLHFPLSKFGPRAVLVRFFGSVHTVDMRLDQIYIRSQPVNSEEGTPMGIGVWYEMCVHNPVEYLFENADPRGSLRANVASDVVRCLSNMPLDELLTRRHGMSRSVRGEVSPKAEDWGYRLGSVYIRKVHFRDQEMIRQIEQKVVNRLRQVTSAIVQAGTNRVDVIMSRAEKESASEFARAAAKRPQIVGAALRDLSADPEILNAVFEILQTRQILDGDAEVTILAGDGDADVLSSLLATKDLAGKDLVTES